MNIRRKAAARLILWQLVGLNLLNGLDILTTLYMCLVHQGYEVNPLMRVLLDWHPAAFVAVKLLIMGFLTRLVCRLRYQTRLLTWLSLLTGIYTFVIVSNLLGCIVVSVVR